MIDIDIRLGQDIFDLAIQSFGRIDDLSALLVAAQGFEVTPGAAIAIKKDSPGNDRLLTRFAAIDYRPVNSTFGISDFATLGIPIMVIGSTFIVR